MAKRSTSSTKPGPRILWIVLAIWTPICIWAMWSIWQKVPSQSPLLGDELNKGLSLDSLHRTLYPIYPWLLLAPYLIGICIWMPLGIRRARLAIPTLALSAGLFIAISLGLHDRLTRSMPLLTISGDGSELAGQLSDAIRGAFFSAGQASTGTNDSGQAIATRMEVYALPFGSKWTNNDNALLEGRGISINSSIQTNVVLKKFDQDVEFMERGLAGLIGANFELMGSDVQAEISHELQSETSAVKARPLVFAGFHLGGFILLAGLAHAGIFFYQFQDRKQRSVRLSNELTQARLTHLQSQIQPHFLFNALNGISSQVHEKPDEAVDMIANLGELLRLSLEQSTKAGLIPLDRELSILDHYLELQMMRFSDRLVIQRDIDSAGLACPVPAFLLQPLAENVIQHVLEPHSAVCSIQLSAHCRDRHLVIQLRDDGPGLSPTPSSKGSGTGIRNLRERLATLYGDDYILTVTNAVPGTLVELHLPIPPA